MGISAHSTCKGYFHTNKHSSPRQVSEKWSRSPSSCALALVLAVVAEVVSSLIFTQIHLRHSQSTLCHRLSEYSHSRCHSPNIRPLPNLWHNTCTTSQVYVSSCFGAKQNRRRCCHKMRVGAGSQSNVTNQSITCDILYVGAPWWAPRCAGRDFLTLSHKTTSKPHKFPRDI